MLTGSMGSSIRGHRAHQLKCRVSGLETVDASRNGHLPQNPLNLEDASDFRTKCHELGHYALNLGDEYMFADGKAVSWQTLVAVGRCQLRLHGSAARESMEPVGIGNVQYLTVIKMGDVRIPKQFVVPLRLLVGI